RPSRARRRRMRAGSSPQLPRLHASNATGSWGKRTVANHCRLPDDSGILPVAVVLHGVGRYSGQINKNVSDLLLFCFEKRRSLTLLFSRAFGPKPASTRAHGQDARATSSGTPVLRVSETRTGPLHKERGRDRRICSIRTARCAIFISIGYNLLRPGG